MVAAMRQVSILTGVRTEVEFWVGVNYCLFVLRGTMENAY